MIQFLTKNPFTFQYSFCYFVIDMSLAQSITILQYKQPINVKLLSSGRSEFSHQCFWRFKSSGLWCVVSRVVPSVSNSHSTFISCIMQSMWIFLTLRDEGTTLLQNIRDQWRTEGEGLGCSNPPTPKFWRPSKIVPNSTRFVKTVKNCCI